MLDCLKLSEISPILIKHILFNRVIDSNSVVVSIDFHKAVHPIQIFTTKKYCTYSLGSYI